MHAPYISHLIHHNRYRTKALFHKDRFSVGVIILEMLIGTDLVIAATLEELLKKLLYDCCPYLDPETYKVLSYLILDEDEVDLNAYIKNDITSEHKVIRANILKVEAALLEDAELIKWQNRGSEMLSKNPNAAYDKYRLYPADPKHNVDWEAIAQDSPCHALSD
jgi:hypothetical protein